MGSLQEKCSSTTPSRRHQFSTMRHQIILATPKQVSPPRRPSPVAKKNRRRIKIFASKNYIFVTLNIKRASFVTHNNTFNDT